MKVSPAADSLSDEELNEIVGEFPGDILSESPEEMAYLIAYIRETIWTSPTFEHTDLYIDLVHRFPRPLEVYRDRAEDVRWRRLDRAWRVRQEFSVGV
jgi:hypothetical protein